MKLKISKIYVHIVVLKVKMSRNSPKRKKRRAERGLRKKKRPPNKKKRKSACSKKKTAGAFGGRFVASSFSLVHTTVMYQTEPATQERRVDSEEGHIMQISKRTDIATSGR